jgi:hypothetical protein
MACKLTTLIDAHSVLHRLEKVATASDLYSDVDFSDHSFSPTHGTLVLTRVMPNGERLPLAITQDGDRLLVAELAQSHPSPNEAIREAVYPLVDAYLAEYKDALDNISQNYQP